MSKRTKKRNSKLENRNPLTEKTKLETRKSKLGVPFRRANFEFPVSNFQFRASSPVTQSPDRTITNVLFVCFGNACRSQIAEALANHLGQDRIRAWSAGAYPLGWIPSETGEVLEEKGISLNEHRTKGLKNVPLAEMDVVVEMEAGIVGALPGNFKGRLIAWDIPDPFNGDLEVFRTVRDLIERHVSALLAEL